MNQQAVGRSSTEQRINIPGLSMDGWMEIYLRTVMVHQLIRVIRHPESEITQPAATDDRSHARSAQHSQKLLVEQQLEHRNQAGKVMWGAVQ